MARRKTVGTIPSQRNLTGIDERYSKVTTDYGAAVYYRNDLGDLTREDLDAVLAMKPKVLGVTPRLADGVTDYLQEVKAKVEVRISRGIAPCEVWLLKPRPESEVNQERAESAKIAEEVRASMARELERRGRNPDKPRRSVRDTLPVYAKDIQKLVNDGLEVRDITKLYRREKKLKLSAGQVRAMLEGRSKRGYVRCQIIKDAK